MTKATKSAINSKFPPPINNEQRSNRNNKEINNTEQIINDVTTSLDNNNQILSEIQEKMLHSPALNGGFDSLLIKVDRIEIGQTQIVQKLTSIHEAIYHPDDGLFARVKMVEITKLDSVDKLEKEILEISLWKTSEEKIKEKQIEVDEEQEKLLMFHDDQLKSVIEFRDRISSAFKWVAVSVSTGGLGVLGKLIYDFFAGHVKFM
jgi:hypothetical protein